MTCPYYRGNGTDGRGWPTIGCLAIPQRQISFMAKVSHEATVNKVCLGKYPQCHYFKKQEEDNHER